MRSAVKGYLLREYGSWSVLTVSFVAGLGVSKGFAWEAIPLFLALVLLVNSKQAFLRWIRGVEGRTSAIVFIAQILLACVILFSLFSRQILQLLPLLLFPFAYLVLARFSGEHSLPTELLGFCLLSLAAVIAKFLIVQGVDIRLFVAVSLYFMAGVFKIKILLLRRMRDRVLMLLYLGVALYCYYRLDVAWLILAPLGENLISALTTYRVRLRTTGWIEVAKSTVFLTLLLAYF
jgi:hypothetical protein